jgi:hypothetical protein
VNWPLAKVPRVLHLYWGKNRPLSYARFLTAVSFVELNPDWDVRVHYPEEPVAAEPWGTPEQKGPARYDGWDYFGNLAELRQVELVPSRIGAGLPEVPRSDLLRWHLLAEQGGVWSDFDVLWTRPLSEVPIERGERAEALVCLHGWASVGFLASSGEGFGREFHRRVFEEAVRGVDAREYQSAGRFAVERVLERLIGSPDGALVNLPYAVVYPVPPHQTARYYEKAPLVLGPETIGLHWFGGHPASVRAEAELREGNVRRFGETSALAREMVRYSW